MGLIKRISKKLEERKKARIARALNTFIESVIENDMRSRQSIPSDLPGLALSFLFTKYGLSVEEAKAVVAELMEQKGL